MRRGIMTESTMQYMNCGQTSSRLTGKRFFDRQKNWQVCPFEMSLDLSVWMDAVICDYNYVFDPNVYLKRFFFPREKRAIIFFW